MPDSLEAVVASISESVQLLLTGSKRASAAGMTVRQVKSGRVDDNADAHGIHCLKKSAGPVAIHIKGMTDNVGAEMMEAA